MWRSAFLALGLTCILLGVECMMLDRAVLANRNGGDSLAGTTPTLREFKPAEWAPWSLLSAGAVVMIYTVTVPKKWKE